jgi:phosphatidylserine/phosphatidylglycerophosphate/cardiolipin synthase-like enzyme
MNKLVAALDEKLGDALDATIVAHHNRRLRRIDWERAIDPPRDGNLWAAGDPPVRQGNKIEVLVDGGNAFPTILETLSQARSHVHLAGWMVSRSFKVVRGEEPLSFRDMLAELAERVDVRLLLWGGAPLPNFLRESRKETRKKAHAMCKGTKIKLGLDSKERPMHCHHEKVIVVDDKVAFVGGIDWTVFGGDRYDTPDHPPKGELGWHDVGTRLEGPIVSDVIDHFSMRWLETTGEKLSPPPEQPTAGGSEIQLVRTVPEKVYDSLPKGDFRILESYMRALRSAQHFIYIENQFLWSPRIVDLLADKLADPPSEDFRLICLLPSHPTTGEDDTRGQLGQLKEADDGRDSFLACGVWARGAAEHSDPIYIHAKVCIVDDRWMTIGSANLNNHSLFNDSEVNVVTSDSDLIERTRHRLWAEHLEMDVSDISGAPAKMFDEYWAPISKEQAEKREAGVAMTHRLARLPHVSKRSARLKGPIQSLLVDG